MKNTDRKLMVVIGKKWQDGNGNTQHTAEIISFDYMGKSKVTYGYGNHFIKTAREMLESENIDINDYIVIDRQIYVDRRKDL